MSRRRNFRRIREREATLQLRMRHRHRKTHHACEPQYRGAGHAYAYCEHCGRAMTDYSQREHDLVQVLKQISQAPVVGEEKEDENSQDV